MRALAKFLQATDLKLCWGLAFGPRSGGAGAAGAVGVLVCCKTATEVLQRLSSVQ